MQFKLTSFGLILWLSWVDDFMVCGPEEAVIHEKRIMGKMFPCDDMGKMEEYIGCKIERNYDKQSLRLTQPVLLRSFQDEFDMTQLGKPMTPAIPGSALTKTNTEGEAPHHIQSNYRKGVGKLLHLTRWTSPEIMNAVHELSPTIHDQSPDGSLESRVPSDGLLCGHTTTTRAMHCSR
jgi:hypothetical protein